MFYLYRWFILICFLFACGEKSILIHDSDASNNEICFRIKSNDSDLEIVIHNVLHISHFEDSYYFLRGLDELCIKANGKMYFRMGLKNTLLTELILDIGDIIDISVINRDSVYIESANSDFSSDLDWLNIYRDSLYYGYKKVLNSLVSLPDYAEELSREKVYVTIDNEIIDISLDIGSIFLLDRLTYNNNRISYDSQIIRMYDEYLFDIENSSFDSGARAILRNELNRCTVDFVNRLNSITLQDWIKGKLQTTILADCSNQMSILDMHDYVQYSIPKSRLNITALDYAKLLRTFVDLDCESKRVELSRTCIKMIFAEEILVKVSKQLLDDYLLWSHDTILYTYLDNLYGINMNFGENNNADDIVLDINNQLHSIDSIIQLSSGKILIVDLWASWCAPCRKGIPITKELKSKYSEELDIVYLSIDAYPNPWKKATSDEKLLSSFWFRDYEYSNLRKLLRSINIPHYAIYDQKGSLVFSKINRTESLEGYINELLK